MTPKHLQDASSMHQTPGRAGSCSDAAVQVDENLEIIGNRKLKDISTFKELNFIGKDFLVRRNKH